VLREALARQNDVVLAGFRGRRAIAAVAAAIIVTAAWAAVATALRRSIFGRRKIASALAALMASTTATAATTASTSAAAPASTASAATVATAISTTVTAAIAAVVTLALSAAFIAAGGIAARGIVIGRKILRRRSVGFRLALVHGVMLDFFAGRSGGFGAIVMIGFFVVLVVRFAGGLIEMQNFLAHADGFAGQALDGGAAAVAVSGRLLAGLFVAMAVIVIFQIFKNVADVQESVAIEADVNEGRLHAWEDSSNFSFVDASDEREFLFPLDVDFDQLAFFENRDSTFV
jgi:hypothetical protein